MWFWRRGNQVAPPAAAEKTGKADDDVPRRQMTFRRDEADSPPQIAATATGGGKSCDIRWAARVPNRFPGLTDA